MYFAVGATTPSRQMEAVKVESVHSDQGRSYVLIMPSRNEEDYIQNTIDCITRQTILPTEFIVVNDGSSDNTGPIAQAAADQFPWIHVVHREDRGMRKVGGGVIDTFYSGFEALKTQDYDYLCKIDGDMTFQDDYFEKLLKKFEEDPKLGGASGKPWNPVGDTLVPEGMIDEMVAGQVNFWRRKCWEDIGGFVREVMWDGITFHRSRMFGWKTRSFRDEDLKLIHHRLMGSSQKSIYHGRRRWGRGQWFMGTHPLYIIASGVFRMRERPYILGGLNIILGYFLAWITGVKRYDDPKFRKCLHKWQLGRLGLGWLAR